MLLILFASWLVLSSRLTLEIVLFGIAVTIVAWVFMHAFLGWTYKKELALYKLFPFVVAYFFVVVYSVCQANIAIIPYVWSKKRQPEGILIRFNPGLKSSIAIAVLANSITITPGTITVSEKDGELTVHCLHESFAKGIENQICVKLLRRMEAIV